MKRQQYLQHRLQTLSALGDAVGAMRSLSAHHFRRARLALPAARQYRDEMNTIVAEIGISQPLYVGVPSGLLVIASDLGLCGDYNSRLSELAVEQFHSQVVGPVYSVGRRGRMALAKNSIIPFRSYDAPTSLEGLSQILLRLAQDVMDDYLSLRIGSLQVVSAGFEGVGHFSPLSVRVLPIESVEGAKPVRRSPYVSGNYLMTVAARILLHHPLRDPARCFGRRTRNAADGGRVRPGVD